MSTVLSNEVVEVVTAAFPFEIKKMPLSLPDNVATDMRALVKDTDIGTPIITASVTKGYEPHQTSDVIALVEAASHAFDGEIAARCHWDGGHYVSIQPTKAERLSIFGTQDNIFPRMMIRAGYGGQSFRATMGLFRDACENMSMIRSVKSATVAIRHTSGLRDKMGDLITDFRNLKKSWVKVTDVVHKMQDTNVDIGEYMAAVYTPPTKEKSVATHNGYKRLIKKLISRFEGERDRTGRGRVVDNQASMWEMFNMVQGYCQHTKTRKGDPNKFERMLKGLDDPDVKRAELIAVNGLPLAA